MILPRLPGRRARRGRSDTMPLVVAAVAALLVSSGACWGGGAGRAVETGSGPQSARLKAAPPPPDPVQLYRSIGLIAHGDPFPIVGRVAYLASPSPESTQVVVTLAIPNRALTFTHTADSYQAAYNVHALVRENGDSVTAEHARETVVVASFRETTRADESVIFQQQLRLPPGSYDLLLGVRDEGSERAVADSSVLDVPRLEAGRLGTPVPFYEAVMRERLDDVPRLLAMPRATVIFGRDSTLPVYLESYDAPISNSAPGIPLTAAVHGANGEVVWRDSITLMRRHGELASGVLTLPVSRLGIGAVTLTVWRTDEPEQGRNTVRAPVLVSLGANLPAATFDDVLSYLRFFASPARLDRLRDTPPGERGTAWIAFLDDIGPGSGGGERELQQYLTRLQVANQRYGEEGRPGWLTDRGMVFAAFGEPDSMLEPEATLIAPRDRTQRWVYGERKLSFDFHDVTGLDRWQLEPSSEDMFRVALTKLRG